MITQKDRRSGFFSRMETMSVRERQQFQNWKLRQLIAYAYEKAPAVKKKLDKSKVKPGDIRTVKDLEKLLITEKADLIGLQKKISLSAVLMGFGRKNSAAFLFLPGLSMSREECSMKTAVGPRPYTPVVFELGISAKSHLISIWSLSVLCWIPH
ncbi:MAG: hypothetical protein ABSE95_03985 [Thermodesulfobacteriota bacterium]